MPSLWLTRLQLPTTAPIPPRANPLHRLSDRLPDQPDAHLARANLVVRALAGLGPDDVAVNALSREPAHDAPAARLDLLDERDVVCFRVEREEVGEERRGVREGDHVVVERVEDQDRARDFLLGG